MGPPGVRDIASSLSNDRLEELRVLYEIPDDMAMVVPEPTDRALRPSDGFITVYEIHLKSGLRFPVPIELHGIMKDLGVPLACLQPNAMRYLVSLCVFLRCQEKLLNATVVKVMFRFTHNLDWITMTPRPDFALLCGGNPDSTKRWKDKFFFLGVPQLWDIPRAWGKVVSAYCTEPSLRDKESSKELTDLIKANLGGFHLDKRNIWLLPEKLREARWNTVPEDSSSSESTPRESRKKKKKKRGKKRAGTLVIRSPTVPAEPAQPSVGSGRPVPEGFTQPEAAALSSPGGIVMGEDLLASLADEDVIAPLFKRARPSAPPAASVREVAQDEVLVDVPAEGTAAAPCPALTEGVAAAPVVEPAATVIEPPAVDSFVDISSPEAGEEEYVAPTAEPAATVVEPPAVAPRADASTSAAGVRVSAAPAQVSESREEVPSSDDFLAIEIRDMSGRLSAISGRVARRFSELKEMGAAKEAARKAEAKLAAATKEIASLNDVVRRQQEKLRQQDERLRASFRAEDLVALSERKYWEGIHMCRRILRLVHPRFPCSLLHPLNATVMRVNDLFGITGRPFPSSARAGPPGDPTSPGPSTPSDPAGPSGLFEDLPGLSVSPGSQPPPS